jgi:non-ribosomal peptide synthetase component F/aryl carrier-like protein
VGAGSAAVDPALVAIWAEVLEVDEPNVDDDFFALGGNSLLATQITARIADVLGVEVALDALFEAPTLGAFAQHVRDAAQSPAGAPSAGNAQSGAPERGRGLRSLLRGRRDGGERAEKGAHGGRAGAGGGRGGGAPQGALSQLQASAWSVQRYNPGLQPHVGQVFSLQGPLDVGALERAFGALVARHEPLRTSFPFVDQRPQARVQPPTPFALEQIGGGRRMREEEVRRHVDAAWSESFDYEHAPPLRVRLIRTGKSAHVLVFLLHEIVCDGQSYDLLVRELGQLYAADVAGEPSPLAEPAQQYGAVVRTHGEALGGRDEQGGREHWRSVLAGAPLALSMPHERLGPAEAGAGVPYARRSVQLSTQVVTRLRALAREEAATSFMLHLAALYALLHRWSGERDLLVKSAAANRARVEWEQIVGFFSIVLPLRVDAGGDPSFRALLQRTRDVALGAFRHASYVPEDNALREVAGMRGLGGWSVLFRLWDPTTEQPLALTGVHAKPYRDDGESGRLVLVVTERADRTVAQLSSASRELDARALGELLRHYERLLEQVAEDPDRRIGSELELLSPAERDQLGGRAPAGGRGEAGSGLHGLVAAAAARTPDAVAFDPGGGGSMLTYTELDVWAERIAGALRARGVGVGARVGLRLAPSGELLAAMLGVLKAGAVAVPLLDPGLEDEPEVGLPPLAEVLDAGELARIAGAGSDAAGARGATARTGDAADAAGADASGSAAAAAPGVGRSADEVEPGHVALVVRTAGVSGEPRAVALTHGTLQRAALRQRDALRLTPADRVAHVPGRGAWSWALAPWAALAAGATVVGPERAPPARSSSPPSGWLEAHTVSVAALDPWLAGAALARAAALPASLRLLCVLGDGGPPAMPDGDGLPRRLALQRWYGLTEAGGMVLAERADGPLDPDAPIVGEPSGLRARVLDAHGHVAPAGVLGELELDDGVQPSGDAASGEEASPERGGAGGASAVRTGDLARRRTDGALELLGRAEDELRWRGVRLQPLLRDLETALVTHPAVQDAAACWEPAREALVACVVPRRAQLPERDELDEWLQRTMTDWILPALYVAVETIPLRADGLPDRHALAASGAVASALATAADAEPRTPTERKLAALWKQVLGTRRAGAHDNFFADGGTLIDGIELAERARAAGIAINPGDVMYRPTIAELATIADHRG